LSDDEGDGKSFKGKSALVYNKEQKELRQQFLNSVKDTNDSGSDESSDDDILKVKQKTKEEEEEDREILRQKLDQVINVKDNTTPAGEKFLYDYMLHKKWNFPEQKTSGRIYSHGDREEGNGSADEILDEEEDEMDMVEKFESKYNFRFEELQNNVGYGASAANNSVVMGHSRDVQGSVRRVDDKRKKDRELRKERKEKEKRQKEAELRRLKNLKHQEVCIL
jgi:protein KRI1